MKEKFLTSKKVRRRIVMSTLTALLLVAQTTPSLFMNMSDAEFNSCLSGLPKTVSIAQAYTIQEDNYEELEKEYQIGDRHANWDCLTRDLKYSKVKVQQTGEYHYYKTIEGYENNKELREALKGMLGITLFLPSDIPEDGNHDGVSIPLSALIGYNYFGLTDLLNSKAGRKQLAELGEKYTDWIDADWSAAPEVTLMAVFGVVNDDYGLIEYNNSAKISREEFYTMLCRYTQLSCGERSLEELSTRRGARVNLEKQVGKNYKYSPYIWEINHRMYGVTTGFFYDEDLTASKSYYQSNISYLEACAYIGGVFDISEDVSITKIKKDLIKNFKNITEKSFTSKVKYSRSEQVMNSQDAHYLWSAWKLGVLKPDSNGNLKWTGSVKYSQACKWIVKADREWQKLNKVDRSNVKARTTAYGVAD